MPIAQSKVSPAQVHAALFGVAGALKIKVPVKEGIRKYIRRRYARR